MVLRYDGCDSGELGIVASVRTRSGTIVILYVYSVLARAPTNQEGPTQPTLPPEVLRNHIVTAREAFSCCEIREKHPRRSRTPPWINFDVVPDTKALVSPVTKIATTVVCKYIINPISEGNV